jgi:hypothetical protein
VTPIQATETSFRETNSTLLLLLGGLSCLRKVEEAARALSSADPVQALSAAAVPRARSRAQTRAASNKLRDDMLNNTAMLAVFGLLSVGQTLARLSEAAKPPRRRRRAARPATPTPSRPRDLLR